MQILNYIILFTISFVSFSCNKVQENKTTTEDKEEIEWYGFYGSEKWESGESIALDNSGIYITGSCENEGKGVSPGVLILSRGEKYWAAIMPPGSPAGSTLPFSTR